MGRRRVVRQFAWVSAGRVVAALLQAVVLALVARAVSPTEFGFLGVFLGLAAVAQTFTEMGIATFIIRERAANPQSGDIAVAMRFNTFSSAVLSVLTGIVLLIAGFAAATEWLYLLPLAIWIGAERNADARISIALADGDARINVSNLVGRRALATVILLGLIVAGVDGLLSYSIALAIAAVLSSVFANRYVRERVSPRSGSSFRSVLAESRAYWIHSVATQARNLDVPVVSAVAGATAAGFYSAGSRLTNPLRILPYSLASVLLPEATRAHRSGRSLRPSLVLAGAMGLGVTLLYIALIPLTPWLVQTVLGSQYLGAIAVVQVVLLGMPFAAGVTLAHVILQAIGRKSVVAASSTIFTILTLASVLVAAFLGGALGAAYAMSGVTALQFIYLTIWAIVSLNRPQSLSEDDPDLDPELED